MVILFICKNFISDKGNVMKVKTNLALIVLSFAISVLFFLKLMQDLTWFEDELRGHWLLKRIIFATFLSVGYLAQLKYFKIRFPLISKISLYFTLLFSFLCCFLGSFTLPCLFVSIVFLQVCMRNKNVLA